MVPCEDGGNDDDDEHEHEEEHDDADDVLGVAEVGDDEELVRTPSWEKIGAPVVRHEGDDEHEDDDGVVVHGREDDEDTCNDDVLQLMGVEVALAVDGLLPRLPRRRSDDAQPIPFVLRRDLQRDGALAPLKSWEEKHEGCFDG